MATMKLNSSKLERQLQEAMKKNPEKTAKAVAAIALDLAGRSAERAPIESGDLRNNCAAVINGSVGYENQSATGTAPKAATKVRAKVGYSLPYALRQHEELDYRHDRTDGHRVARAVRYRTKEGKISEYYGFSSVNMVAGGQAKFLEAPFKEQQERYLKLLKAIPGEVLNK